jgi:hypothetical protein
MKRKKQQDVGEQVRDPIITISKDDPDYEGLRWVVKAASKRSKTLPSEPINFVKIDEGKVAYATDGHRIHIYLLEAETKTAGLFDFRMRRGDLVLTPEREVGGDYPTVLNVIPSPEGYRNCVQLTSGSELNGAYTRVVRGMGPECTLQYGHFKDLEDILQHGVTVGIYDEHQPVAFVWERGVALIMPMRVKC